MKKHKVLTIVGTRPEIIRLSRTIPLLDKNLDHVLAHTGQNFDYELNEIFFKDLGIRKPDYFMNAAGDTACQTIGKIITGTEKLIKELSPEAVLILGDTNSSLAAVTAKRYKVPIFHLEAGNRCFDDRVPEEINRRIVDHTADINLTYSAIARQYLINEGLAPDKIIKVGSPMKEILEFYKEKIASSNILDKLALKAQEYFLVSAHREENIDNDSQFELLMKLLNKLASDFNLPIIVSTHPRTRNRINENNIQCNDKVNFLKPLSFTDYVKLQKEAKTTLSDSGTITEESSILNFPALNIRETNERPEGMEEGSVMMTGLNIDRIYQGISILESQERGDKRTLNIVNDYNCTTFSEKVLRVIISYTDYVNREVWKKY